MPTATAAWPGLRCSSRPGPRRPRLCASCPPPGRGRCSSTARSRPARSVSTSRSRCRSWGSRRALRPRCEPHSPTGFPSSSASGRRRSAAIPISAPSHRSRARGLALDGSAGPGVAAPGVGLVTSVPGRNEGGAARYGTISGSSAAAAVVAGAAALLAQARPDLDAAGLRGALVASARRGVGGARSGDRRPGCRIVDGARRRPAARGVRCASPRRTPALRPGHAPQCLAQGRDRRASAGCRARRSRRHHQARARRAPAGRLEARQAVADGGRCCPAAPGGLSGAIRARRGAGRQAPRSPGRPPCP